MCSPLLGLGPRYHHPQPPNRQTEIDISFLSMFNSIHRLVDSHSSLLDQMTQGGVIFAGRGESGSEKQRERWERRVDPKGGAQLLALGFGPNILIDIIRHEDEDV